MDMDILSFDQLTRQVHHIRAQQRADHVLLTFVGTNATGKQLKDFVKQITTTRA